MLHRLCRASVGVALFVAAVSLDAARIEDLQDQLKVLTDTFKRAAREDSELNQLREQIMTAETIEGRRVAFDEYKPKLADLLESQDALLQQVNAALGLTTGLDFEQSPDLTQVLASFDHDLRDIESSLKVLEASAMTLRQNTKFSKTGDVLTRNLAQMRKAFAVLIKERQALMKQAPSGDLDKTHMTRFLEALRISAAMRQQTLFFEFTMTAQAAAVTDYFDQLRNLYATLLKGKSFSIHMRDIGIGNLESATYLSELNEILLDETFVLPNPVDDLELDKALLEVEALEDFYPYDRGGFKFYYDAQLEQWYTRVDRQRIYAPLDDEAASGKFTRMHADGYFYSHAPWYDQPRQLTFTKDWIAELADRNN